MSRKIAKVVFAGLFSLALVGVADGCRKKGPAERAGEKVDNAVERAKDAVDPKGPAEKAGEKLDKALD